MFHSRYVPYSGKFLWDKIFADGSKNENSRILARNRVIEPRERPIRRFYFHGCLANHEIHENFVLRKFPVIRYLVVVMRK